ncbi:hypothetical protein GCM10010493_84050 [Streptomyces lavendulae subsp. grasserius]
MTHCLERLRESAHGRVQRGGDGLDPTGRGPRDLDVSGGVEVVVGRERSPRAASRALGTYGTLPQADLSPEAYEPHLDVDFTGLPQDLAVVS